MILPEMICDPVFAARDVVARPTRRRCKRCNARAVVARISAGPVGFEHRIFGCAICNYAEEVVLAVDPRRAGAIGWLATTTINRG
jgi:hypothetical protein